MLPEVISAVLLGQGERGRHIEMLILTIIAAYLILTAIVTLSVCVLSARMRRHEDWEETPIVDKSSGGHAVPEYQTDVAAS